MKIVNKDFGDWFWGWFNADGFLLISTIFLILGWIFNNKDMLDLFLIFFIIGAVVS